jgi:hypothetical protein
LCMNDFKPGLSRSADQRQRAFEAGVIGLYWVLWACGRTPAIH